MTQFQTSERGVLYVSMVTICTYSQASLSSVQAFIELICIEVQARKEDMRKGGEIFSSTATL